MSGTPYAPQPMRPAGSGSFFPVTLRQDGLSNAPSQAPPYTKYGSEYWGKEGRELTRTPSPTPSESRLLAEKGVSMFSFRAMMSKEYWNPKHIVVAASVMIILILSILLIIFQKTCIRALHPAIQWMHDLPFGWLIPIAIFFIISFPPLFGHEILAILCGVVWGVGAGFAIVSFGTLFGELGNFYFFKRYGRARLQREEKNNIFYACLAHLVRQGGFKIAVISRFSVIPGHLTTAVYSSCGISVWIFIAAAILSMPKQFVQILLGVLAEASIRDGNKPTPKSQQIASGMVIAITTIVTILAWLYIKRQMGRVKPEVIHQWQMARQVHVFEGGMKGFANVLPSDEERQSQETLTDTPRAPEAAQLKFIRGIDVPFPYQESQYV